MPNNQANSTPTVKSPVRPVLLADRDTMKDYTAFLRHLLAGLAEESCPSVLICPLDANADSVVCPSVEVIRHPLFKMPLLGLQNRKAVLAKLVKFKPTVLHCLGTGKARLTRHIAYQLDIPYVLTFNAPCRYLFRPFVSSDYCAALIVSSKTIAEHLLRTHSRFASRIRQINIGAFVEAGCACFSDPRRVTSMVVAQRLDKPSDFGPLLNALKHLAVDGYEFVLAIVGTGPAERRLHGLIKTFGLSQVVTIVGDIRPLRSVFAGVDIFIGPRPSTGFNSQLLEAMSVGTAVACCRGGAGDLLIEDQTAVFFEPHDELSIYSTLQRLLDKREFARQIALAGQNHLREHHSVSRMVSLLIETYLAAQKWYKES
jgi:glycosyltransferase involved in cell wall biosynthesis